MNFIVSVLLAALFRDWKRVTLNHPKMCLFLTRTLKLVPVQPNRSSVITNSF